MNKALLSIVVPVHNEELNLEPLCERLLKTLSQLSYPYEVILVDDGSTDDSAGEVLRLAKLHPSLKLLQLSRNFGKEIAITAGIHHCAGAACLTLDADLQHPPELIPLFVREWEAGAEVIIGVRRSNEGEGMLKRLGSRLFYRLINRMSPLKLVPNETDFRLIDRIVITEFCKLAEQNRMTRALIDWLGFDHAWIPFDAEPRRNGTASYGILKLVRLAFDSMVSLSLFPLKIAGYLGIFITVVAGLFGFFILIEKYVLNDPWRFNFSSPAFLAFVIIFLVGIVLSCLGLVALYIANIHNETLGRPLYVVRPPRSRPIKRQ